MSLSSTSSVADWRDDSSASRLATLPPWDVDAGVRTLGYLAADWAEHWLTQPNGPRAGQKFRLTRDQLTFLLWWYALDDEGNWLFNHGARRLAKGSGKSPFAAVLALIEFCAPVRLERFDDRELGGVRGRPVSMPWVQIAATAESQTANTMRMVRAFAPKGSRLVDEYRIDVGKTKFYRQPEGTLEVITSSATAAEGAEASFVVADETEHWTPSNGGPELMSTLADNLAKSGERLLETANAWKPGVNSVAEATFDDWVAQEEGRLRTESRILYDARIAPPDTDMSDPDSLRAALEWVYDDCDWKRQPDGTLDVRPMMQRIWRKSSRVDDSKRKYLNWPTADLNAWVALQDWTKLYRKVEVPEGTPVGLFFDGSKSRDATALIGCCIGGELDGHVFTVDVWEPDWKRGETVDAGLVDLAVIRAFERFDVLAFFGDVREWESFVLTEWPSRYKDQLQVWAVPSGRPPQPIAWDMRSHTYEFAKACEAVEAEILGGEFTHDGDSRLARHVANARRRAYRDAVGIAKETHDSPDKIDAAVCMVGARMVRRLVLATAKPARDFTIW